MRLSWLIVTALAMPMALAAQTPAPPAPPVATLGLSEALQQAKNNNPLYLQRLNNASTARAQVRNAWGQLLPSASVSGGIDYTGSGQANFGQGFTRQTYHDPDKKSMKEVFQVKDTIRNITPDLVAGLNEAYKKSKIK